MYPNYWFIIRDYSRFQIELLVNHETSHKLNKKAHQMQMEFRIQDDLTDNLGIAHFPFIL
jgi:hypothetical protein